MQPTSAAANDADRLYAILAGEKVHPAVLDAAMRDFDEYAKNAVVSRVAAMFEPPPSGALLDRLLLILTPRNKATMAVAFTANLRSPLPEARRASLSGLEKLGDSEITSFAILSLRDDVDRVVATACQILAERATADPDLRKLLEEVYRARAGKKEFYLSNSILEAKGIGRHAAPEK